MYPDSNNNALIQVKKKRPLKAALFTEQKILGVGLSAMISGMDGILFTDFIYGSEKVKDVLSGSYDWDVLFLDVDSLRLDGIQTVRRLSILKPGLCLIIISEKHNEDEEITYRKSGVKCFLSKCMDKNSYRKSLEPVLEDIFIRNKEIMRANTGTLKISKSEIMERFQRLTPREKEVLKLYIKGKSISDISRIRSRSVKTISSQKQNAMKKMGLSNPMSVFKNLGYLFW